MNKLLEAQIQRELNEVDAAQAAYNEALELTGYKFSSRIVKDSDFKLAYANKLFIASRDLFEDKYGEIDRQKLSISGEIEFNNLDDEEDYYGIEREIFTPAPDVSLEEVSNEGELQAERDAYAHGIAQETDNEVWEVEAYLALGDEDRKAREAVVANDASHEAWLQKNFTEAELYGPF